MLILDERHLECVLAVFGTITTCTDLTERWTSLHLTRNCPHRRRQSYPANSPSSGAIVSGAWVCMANS
jgi:hypothetical protein